MAPKRQLLRRAGRRTEPRRRTQRCWLAGVVLAACLACSGCSHGAEAKDPTALVEEGWARFQAGEFDAALNSFAAAASKAPAGSDPQLQAWYGQATTWHLRRPGQDQGKASALYRSLASQAPDHELAAWSRLGLARLAYAVPADQTPDYAAVSALYQEVIDRYPEHPAAAEASLMVEAMKLETATPSELPGLIAALEAFQDRHTTTPYQAAAWSLRAYANDLLGRPEAAIAASIAAVQATEADIRDPSVDLSHAYWRIACLAEFDLGDFALARTYYTKYMAAYPTDQRVFLAKQEMERMAALEAGFRAAETGRHGH